MIDMKKQYKTRDGRAVTLFTTEAKGLRNGRNVVGTIEDNEYPYSWDRYGKGSLTGDDLLEVKPVREGWVNIYGHPEGNEPFVTRLYSAKKDADFMVLRNEPRLACIKIQFTEGEGL